MVLYQWSLVVIISTLLFNKASRSGAITLLLAYSFYSLFVINLEAIYYYSLTALLNLTAGVYLHNKNKIAALCSYLLVFVNLFGFLIWYLYISPDIYNALSMLLLTVQALSVVPKGNSNGLRYYFKYLVVSCFSFNSSKASDNISKNHTAKKQ